MLFCVEIKIHYVINFLRKSDNNFIKIHPTNLNWHLSSSGHFKFTRLYFQITVTKYHSILSTFFCWFYLTIKKKPS